MCYSLFRENSKRGLSPFSYIMTKKALNLITKNTRDLNRFEQLQPSEVTLYDNFTRELDITNNYVQARTSALRDATLRERDFGQDCLDRVACIKKFIGVDANKITQGQLENINYNPDHICTKVEFDSLTIFFRLILKKMPEPMTETFLYCADNYPIVLFFALQPAFLLAFGIHYPKLIHLLLGRGNLLGVLTYCKNALMKKNVLAKLNLFCKKLPVLLRPITYTLGTVGVSISLTLLLGYCSSAGFLNLNKPITNSTTDKNPLISVKDYRQGGEVSALVDKAAGNTRTMLAEATSFFRTSMSGVYTELIRGGIEAYNEIEVERSTEKPTIEKNNTKS